jgi:hypothetical protein
LASDPAYILKTFLDRHTWKPCKDILYTVITERTQVSLFREIKKERYICVQENIIEQLKHG